MSRLMVVLVGGLVRAACLLVSFVLAFSDATRDVVGIGILLLPVVALFALLVACYDGWRVGLLAGWATWVLTSVLFAFGVPAFEAIVSASSVATLVDEDSAVLGLLAFVPAVVGVAIGALVGRVRRSERPT